MKTLTELLDEIKSRADSATEGPWKVYDENKGVVRINNDITCGFLIGQEKNSRFIAHARTDVPALVESVEFLIEIIEESHYFCFNGTDLPDRLTKILQKSQGGEG